MIDPALTVPNQSKYRRIATVAALFILFLLLTAPPAQAGKSIYDWAFVRLDHARKEKVERLQSFCSRIHDLARKAASDQMMRDCFLINLAFHEACKKNVAPPDLKDKVKTLRQTFAIYYIKNYFSFYDISFIHRNGEMVFSLRNEHRCSENLIADHPCPLSQALQRARDQESFVDFHDYGPSSEPAAFFIEPVKDGPELKGWIVLQCAINKVNAIFSGTESLGQTGETFLVNQYGLMLTDSNFLGSSTILSKKLDDRNIKTKFDEGQGHRTVIDYRNHHALSSFEVVEFMDTRWLVVAKVDRGEIITAHYGLHRKYYADRILRELAQQAEMYPAKQPQPNLAVSDDTRRIDMDEFARAGTDEELCTYGIATCTGLIVAYPNKFAYLAHISPIDRLYGQPGSNLLGQIIKKVNSFDIYPREKRALIFTLIAPHQDIFAAAVNKLIDEGFFLSQINIYFNPGAASASVSYNCRDNRPVISWKEKPDSAAGHFQPQVEAINLGSIIHAILAEDSPEFKNYKTSTNNHQT